MILRKTIPATLLALTLTTFLGAQTVKDFKPALDSMQTLLRERTTVASIIKAKKVVKREKTIDFHFTNTFGDYPWRESDVKWFRTTLKDLFPKPWSDFSVGEIFIGSNPLESYVMPTVGSNGKPRSAMFRTKDRRGQDRFITKVGAQDFNKGLSGRVIAMWQSHGRYYEESKDKWRWQRAPLFQTVEDMYTQSYVLPFLMPMLENAGAYVMTPRERDPQRYEIIADNDQAFKEGRGEGVRIVGFYSESGQWHDAGVGFADYKAVYTGRDNPFKAGTARQAICKGGDDDESAMAVWTPDIPARGEYSVYISYKSLPNSCESAHYTVNHLGGKSEFTVNQKMGGGTWIYLGTFEFEKGTSGFVSLDNDGGQKAGGNTVVTADAVRFGGGMGKVARGPKDVDPSEYTLSSLPSFAEGAYYWMQWAGADTTLLNLHEGDYTADFGERGAWVDWMSGGSRTNPQKPGLGIPVDMSFAFHSDAGTFPNDSIVGTLAIYTLMSDGKDKLPNGETRWQGRMLADFVQTQVVEDIRKAYNPRWTRRGLWDRSYSETRTTTVPGMLLELLSHQNFEDMKHGLDPSFRFAVSRAVYKGILKYMSARFGHEYAVQPLPVRSFSATMAGSQGNGQAVRLKWIPTLDSLETTAVPEGYILQTRIGDGGFDEGRLIDFTSEGGKCFYDVAIEPGKLYSFRIIAFNEGGMSFPSETLCAGVPAEGNGKSVLVVNNFTRVAPPAWFDTPDYAGFMNNLDAGVPYMREINFIGDQYQFRRDLPGLMENEALVLQFPHADAGGVPDIARFLIPVQCGSGRLVCPGSEGVVIRDSEGVSVLAQVLESKLRGETLQRKVQKGEIDLPLCEQIGQLVGTELADAEGDVRIGVDEGGEHGAELDALQAGDEADGERALMHAGIGGHLLRQFFRAAEDLPRPADKLRPRFRRDGSPWIPVEQAHAHFLFQPCDELGKGGLSDVADFRGLTEIAAVRDADDVFHDGKIHDVSFLLRRLGQPHYITKSDGSGYKHQFDSL